ncbi:Metal tolerance protein 9 [Vitis vinifera]|uniref:Metal tolerance protein 9 n=1 Tax=Vitis vinifera TaxID=29760 RepID=A0A438IFT6_VITVI|nr:Metal tolerance protein 9 [Vitis vinifera]
MKSETGEDYRTELLHQARPEAKSWRLNLREFRLPERRSADPPFSLKGLLHHMTPMFILERDKMLGLEALGNFLPPAPPPPPPNPTFGYKNNFMSTPLDLEIWEQRNSPWKKGKVAEYYKKQERLLEAYNEMETINSMGCLPGRLTEDELKQLEMNERMAIYASNIANLVLFTAKVYASFESRSLAVIASTLDSFLDLLSGFILWFTAHAMRTPNQYRYPIGKKRMQPVGIIVFASVMATLGLQILLESVRQLISGSRSKMDGEKEKWMIGIMVSVTVVKFVLMVYCRRFKNEIVSAYAKDHFFDVITNSIGLATAVLAVHFYWWIDPVGALIIAGYTIGTWAKTVIENVCESIYFGSHYFVEVDIVLPEDMFLGRAHNIGETLQEKLEQLPEVERAFVHIDFEFTHRPSTRQRYDDDDDDAEPSLGFLDA